MPGTDATPADHQLLLTGGREKCHRSPPDRMLLLLLPFSHWGGPSATPVYAGMTSLSKPAKNTHSHAASVAAPDGSGRMRIERSQARLWSQPLSA